MKVEVELGEIENLKNQISILEKENQKLSQIIQNLDEKKLKEYAVYLAEKMFVDVINTVFSRLGFAKDESIYYNDFNKLQERLGERWWCSERLDVAIGATITNQFREAFLRLGIKTENKE